MVASFASWFQASEACKLKGGHLASIHSQEESQAIFNFIHANIHWSFAGIDVWIGGHMLRGNNSWEWSDGTLWDFEFLGEPTKAKDNNERKRFCLRMKMDNGRWQHQFCHKIGERLPFICKIKALKGIWKILFVCYKCDYHRASTGLCAQPPHCSRHS